jgi:hypothetical protein
MLCKYKDAFGQPSQGPHKYRLFGMAIVDWVLTIILALIIARWQQFSFIATLIVLFVVGQLLHFIFCVDTAFMKFIHLR